MFDWSKISTVLLDMDGTLLDLHFDNYFWLCHLPQRYSELANISIAEAKKELLGHYEKVAGTIDWYCLDYWTEQLNLPIVALKREIEEKISLRPDTLPFLDALKAAGKEVVLVTNAHPDSLSLKVEKTALDQHIDLLISTHKYGVTKESQSLWQQLQADLNFDNDKTLFVDDSINILDSAKKFGIEHLLAVANPDSQQAQLCASKLKGYKAVTDYREIIKALN
ncbi:GMP/IMP nucleotidase [Thalassotalea sp. PLHSN55]|uniref:GMP/IMP nucleotidase n=1 Tax=Thalassotalea sp. PLHSN55 TaxID=3435888 RepID=UPI003F837681